MAEMEFIKQVSRLKQFLADNANDPETGEPRYRVVGYQKQKLNASDIATLPMVQVFYAGGSFPRSSSGMNAETAHNAIASVIMTVSEKAKVDLAVLQNEGSTPEQLMGAINGVADAESEADARIDVLFGIMFRLIMGADGEHFGSDERPYTVADRWGDDFKKDPVISAGSIVTIKGSYSIGFSVRETPYGDEPTVGSIMSGEIDIQDGHGDPLAVETES